MSLTFVSSGGYKRWGLFQTLPLQLRMKKLLQKRIFPGFRIGEGLAWLLFHFMWAFVLGSIYYLGDVFDPKQFMTLESFAFIQLYVLPVKAFFILPCWWFYFVLLKNKPLLSKVLLHILTSIIYSLAVVGSIYLIKSGILSDPYSKKSMVSDVYFNLTFYFSHFTLFHAYNFYLDIKEQAKKEIALKELAYRSEITALKAQIEPHFLFNTLNSISASVPANLETTRVLVAQLADTFRYALRVSERQMVILQEELEFVKTWLALEQHRLGKRLVIIYDIDPGSLSTLVPSLILQPIIENAIEHGIGPNVNGGTVTISCKETAGFVRVSVSDTGVGFEGDLNEIFSKGVGLQNTAKRLLYFYNQPLVVNRAAGGLQFSFTIPVS